MLSDATRHGRLDVRRPQHIVAARGQLEGGVWLRSRSSLRVVSFRRCRTEAVSTRTRAGGFSGAIPRDCRQHNVLRAQ